MTSNHICSVVRTTLVVTTRAKGCRLAIVRLAICLLLAALPRITTAQEAVLIDPRSFELDLPPGRVVAGDGLRVTTADDSGQPVIGRVHVKVGDGAIILLPDGKLVARKAGQFAPSDREFEPADVEELSKKLAADFPGFKTKKTNHYIYVYDTSDEFALATSRILETMLPAVKGYAEINKIPVHDPEVPLVAIMFKTEDEFQKFRRMPDGVVAYYHTIDNRVFMYEQSRLAEVRPDLAVQQSISTIAHEGAHQILHNIGVQQRLSVWPMWLSEGLAEFFAPTSTGSRLRYKGAGQVNDLRMFELEQFLKSNAATEPSGEMVEQTVLAARLSSTGYASAWALTHHLAKNRRTEFVAYLREISQIGPLSGAVDVSPTGVVASNRDVFVKHFGEDLKSIETRLILHLKKQPYTDPFASAPHFVATMVASDGRRPQRTANTFHSPALAAKWLRDSIDKLPEERRASADQALRAFPNRAQAEAFARAWLQGR